MRYIFVINLCLIIISSSCKKKESINSNLSNSLTNANKCKIVSIQPLYENKSNILNVYYGYLYSEENLVKIRSASNTSIEITYDGDKPIIINSPTEKYYYYYKENNIKYCVMKLSRGPLETTIEDTIIYTYDGEKLSHAENTYAIGKRIFKIDFLYDIDGSLIESSYKINAGDIDSTYNYSYRYKYEYYQEVVNPFYQEDLLIFQATCFQRLHSAFNWGQLSKKAIKRMSSIENDSLQHEISQFHYKVNLHSIPESLGIKQRNYSSSYNLFYDCK